MTSLIKSPKTLLQDLSQLRSSDTAFIVGGGPSVSRLLPDPSILPPENTIVTNNAYKLVPNALACHFADDCWYQWNSEKLNKSFKNAITTCTEVDRNVWRNVVTCFAKNTKVNFTTNTDVLTGMNAGHQAINLAYHIGFRKMVLIGFDLNPEDKQQNWHTEHKRVTNLDNYRHVHLPGFEDLSMYQNPYNFRCFNVNRQSKLQCFEFADLSTFIS